MTIGESLKNTYNDLPSLIKITLIIAAIVLTWILVKRISRRVQNQQEIANAKLEQNQFIQNGETPTLQESEYGDLAIALYNSMAGAGTWDDDFDGVFNKLENNVDFLKLKSAFGIRDGYTFQEWIDGDLSPARKAKINSSLSAKGIIYKI